MDDTENKKEIKEEIKHKICSECSYRFGTMCMFYHRQVLLIDPACEHFINFLSD